MVRIQFFRSLSSWYLSIGICAGAHACPGRFFAANELKLMLAHIVTHYDVKMVNGVRPDNRHFGGSCVPDPKGEVMFRKRHD